MFEDFKSKFSKQNKQKKEELKKLFSTNKKDDCDKGNDKIVNKKEEKEKIIQFELSNGEIIKAKLTVLKKYPNSVLSIYINSENKCPKRNGNCFIDREPENFKNLLYYLENGRLPNFKNISEEKKFFLEIEFWRIPLNNQSTSTTKFNPIYNPHFFTFDKNYQIISKSIFKKGIILLNKKLNAQNPYIEFNVYLNSSNREKKILLALVDESKIEKEDLNKTFDTGIPFVVYWDLFGDRIIKNCNENNILNLHKEFKIMEMKKICRCYKDNYEIKYGLSYNQQEHSVELYRDDIKLDIKILNINPGLSPAFEISNVNCKIKLSQKIKHQDKFFL